MIKMFKTTVLLSAYLVAALWAAGVSVAPSYADDEVDVTYYAFVTHKLDGQTEWKTAYNEIVLKPGRYRFQIVMFPKSLEEESPNWITLRGEFKFVKDVMLGGVKLDDQSPYPLDNGNIDNPNDNSLWIKKTDWDAVRDDQLKPITGKMFDERVADNNKAGGGAPNPNLMRFLLLKKEEDESWPLAGKNYRLYRLHYITADNINKLSKKALSRFLNPAETPTEDAEQLNDWVDSHDSFELAKYLGQADDKHKELYQNFKTWFQTLSITPPPLPPSTGGEKNNSSDWMMTVWAVLFVVVITIIALFVAFPDLVPVRLPRRQHDDDDLEDDFGSPKIHPSRYSPAARQRNSALRSSTKNAVVASSSKEVEELKRKVELLSTQLEQLQSAGGGATLPYGTEPQAIEQRFTELFDQNISRYLSQNESFQKTVNTEIERSLTQLNSYLNQRFHQILDNQVKEQVKYYWDQLTENQNNETAPALPKAYLTHSKSVKQPQGYQPPAKPQPPRTPSRHLAIPTTTRQQPKPTGNEVIDNIKSLLLSMKSVDEAALNALDTRVETCSFVTQVVANCLKSNQPATHYQRLDDGIQELTENRVSLIIPNIGDDIRPEEHNAMSTQTATKGKLNTIASLLRPGVKCDHIIRRKAEVIQTI